MESQPSEILSQILSPGRLVTLVALLLATWLSLRILAAALERLVRRFPRHRLLLNRGVPLLRVLVWIVVVYIAIVEVLEPPRETLLGLAASAGLAIGLAAQDLVKNVLSGLLMIFERPFQVGDVIGAQGMYGEVVSIGLRSTSLRAFEDSSVTIPNGKLFEDVISNENAGRLHQLVSVSFTLPARVDVVAAKQLAREAASISPYAWLGGPISVGVEDEFHRGFLTRYTLRAYVIDIRLQRTFGSDLLERIKRETLRRGWLDPTTPAWGLTA